MESESSLPYSQAPATCPYPVQNSIQSPPPFPTSWRSILILSSHLRLSLPNGLFPSGFPIKTLYTTLLSSIRAICPAHLNLLDFITRKILGEEYRSLSSSKKIVSKKAIHWKWLTFLSLQMRKMIEGGLVLYKYGCCKYTVCCQQW